MSDTATIETTRRVQMIRTLAASEGGYRKREHLLRLLAKLPEEMAVDLRVELRIDKMS